MFQPNDVFSSGGPSAHFILPPSLEEDIMSTTDKDVLNGRGQGVQRLPGNVNYRKLVHVNKGLYAKCPRNDKTKISKGIVDAVRALGGRFLELDERSGIYHDIGNKKAMEKTSQALREGQTEIRKGILRGEGKAAGLPDGAPENCSSSNFDSYQNNNVPPPNVVHEMSPQGYFDFSCKVLQSFYVTEEREFVTSDATEDTLQQMYNAANVTPTTPVHAPTPTAANENSVDMAMLHDQFPGVFQSQSQVDPLLQAPIGRFTGMSSTFRPSFGDYRLSGMSLASVFSINTLRQLIESTQSENNSSEYRDTIQSVVNAEVMELFQKTMPQLEEIENGAMAEDDSDHENREVDLFHEDPSAELDFRLTDVSAWDGFDARMSMMSIDDKPGEKADV